MPSPFPGMDPFIEARGLWEDFHTKLIGEIERTLAAAAPEKYLVRSGERSYIVLLDDNGKETHSSQPDVSVKTREVADRGSQTAAVASVAIDDDSVVLRAYASEEFRESFVEIHEADGEQRLVTCIEVLSPSNKRPNTKGWKLYQRKRKALMTAEINLVEIDLVRNGAKMPLLDPWPTCPYSVLVCRGTGLGACRVWKAFSLKPLPVVPVPLEKPDPDIPLNLQPLVDAIYKRSRYEKSIDYRKPIAPPLSEEEAAWLRERLPSAAKA